LKRSIQINDGTKKYVITPFAEDGSPVVPEANPGAEQQPQQSVTRKGGLVTYVITITDTGERKQMFGFTARHIKSTMTAESSPDACNKTNMKIETDGWYIDFEYHLNCNQERPPQAPSRGRRPAAPCVDRFAYRNVGNGRKGFALIETTTFYGEDGTPMSTTTEVTELSTKTLDPMLFDIPAGYAEVKSSRDLYGMGDMASMIAQAQQQAQKQQQEQAGREERTPVEPTGAASATMAVPTKAPGAIRIGVVAIDNKASAGVSVESLRSALIGQINGSNIDAVPLNSRAPSDLEDEAKQKSCDFILFTTLTDMKKSAASKIGGFIGREAGVPSGGDKFESKVDFRLFVTGEQVPKFSSSEKAKEDSETNSATAALGREAKAVVSAAKKH
jgi:hypothetical protein